MAIATYKIADDNKVALECLTLHVGTTASSKTDLECDEFTVGYPFEIVSVEVYCTAITADSTVDLLIGSTSVCSDITPVAGTPTAGTLSTTLANIRGDSDDTLKLTYTTDADGAITNGRVRVWIKPQGLNGQNVSEA